MQTTIEPKQFMQEQKAHKHVYSFLNLGFVVYSCSMFTIRKGAYEHYKTYVFNTTQKFYHHPQHISFHLSSVILSIFFICIIFYMCGGGHHNTVHSFNTRNREDEAGGHMIKAWWDNHNINSGKKFGALSLSTSSKDIHPSTEFTNYLLATKEFILRTNTTGPSDTWADDMLDEIATHWLATKVLKQITITWPLNIWQMC